MLLNTMRSCGGRIGPIVLLALVMSSPAFAQLVDNTISYQGRLDIGGMPASGTFSFQAAIFSVAEMGTPLQTLDEISGVNVEEGLVNLSLTFQEDIFNGDQRYLELRVREPGGPLTILEPRQAVFAAPYSLNTNKLNGDIFQRGTIGDCSSPDSVPGTGSMNFPRPFSAAPMLFLSGDESGDQSGCVGEGILGKDEQGFSWITINISGQVSPCGCLHWLAIGPP
ncbi:MAG: hypothetical protein Tsb002_03000 [Wenzhouxiangellaceae bacterium]